MVRHAGMLHLETSALRLILDTRRGLRALRLENRVTGRTRRLEGPEIEVLADGATDRRWIQGWTYLVSNREDLHDPDLDDGGWRKRETPANLGRWDTGDLDPGDWVWLRTRVFVPGEWRGLPVWLTLGGFGLHDWRVTQIWLNGRAVGARETTAFWSGPVHLRLDPVDIRFGVINHLALRVREQVTRTPELDAVDPAGGRHFPGADVLGSPFDQVLSAGRRPHRRPRLRLAGVSRRRPGELVARLVSPEGDLTAAVTYRAIERGRVIRRTVTLRNTGSAPLMVMDVQLGRYTSEGPVSRGGQGFPVYLDEEVFLGLEHPSGWVTGENANVLMRQHPGRVLAPGETFECMASVLGVAKAGGARDAFLAYVGRRMRRVRRGHARPYAIYDNFGSWRLRPDVADHWNLNSEKDVLRAAGQLERAGRATGLRFDLFSVDFWADPAGDLYRADPARFPHQLTRIREALARTDTSPGLWIDSSLSTWSAGRNPALAGTHTHGPEYPPDAPFGPWFCRATEPARGLWTTAFARHIRDNGVRLVKFDNLRSFCHNPAHDHLPGKYSTEAIHDGVRRTLDTLDTVRADVVLMLYWGYRSPWWLLHADTLFEPGLDIEAASPSATPTPWARDGVTVGLDQAQRWCRDVPPLGKDSLGVWLSDWAWNSSIGRERWPEAFIMDLCRGSLLAQPWGDETWMTAPERRLMADLIALLRARPGCFVGSRPVLGDPWREEPYGYCCTDGLRAFIAVNNRTWSDTVVTLELGPAWGLAKGRPYDLYRWYPNRARLTPAGRGAGGAFTGATSLALRPFEVILLEVSPAGSPPTLARSFRPVGIPAAFSRPSLGVPVDVSVSTRREDGNREPLRVLRLSGRLPADGGRGILCCGVSMTRRGTIRLQGDPGSRWAAVARVGGKVAPIRPVLGAKGYPSGWQAWRIAVEVARGERFSLVVTIRASASDRLVPSVHWLPQ